MSLRVLIVEDEAPIALHLESILEDAGHEVVGIAATTQQALKMASLATPFDVALMDIDLVDGPVGIDVARRLRQDHDVASLFVSAHLNERTRALALQWKPVGFVAKPFVEDDIVTALRSVAQN